MNPFTITAERRTYCGHTLKILNYSEAACLSRNGVADDNSEFYSFSDFLGSHICISKIVRLCLSFILQVITDPSLGLPRVLGSSSPENNAAMSYCAAQTQRAPFVRR